jgi:hypothetical protein
VFLRDAISMEPAQLRDIPEIGASLRNVAVNADCYRIWIDGSILRVEATGTWDAAVAEAYRRAIEAVVAKMRPVCPHLRVIVDRSQGPIFEAGVAERLMTTFRSILRSGDRIAIVVTSSHAKGEVRRLADREETQTFLSLSAARTWALAYG